MPGGGTLTIEAANLSRKDLLPAAGLEPGEYVIMRVSDTGTGMPKEVLDRVFDPFFTTKPKGVGTGLGLSVAYGYAKQSRGHLQIEREVGAGTTVNLYLPRSHDKVTNQELAASAEFASQGVGDTVLVLEDDVDVRMTLVDLLRELGYQTLAAIDGKSAVPILQSKQRIDLLISDVGLPGLNGRQLAEIGRQHRPDLKVLFITGYAETTAVPGGFLAPGMEMITKPITLHALAVRIRAIIEHDPQNP
jgi:CheY-like chemotaxis protein